MRRILRGVAVAAVLALALSTPGEPYAADSEQPLWTDNLVPLEEPVRQAFEGTLRFNLGTLGKMSCQVTIEIEAEAPSAGSITAFRPTTNTCESKNPVLNECIIVADGSNAPRTLSSLSSMEATGGLSLHFELSSCSIPTLGLNFSSLLLTPHLNEANTIAWLCVTGATGGGITVHGSVFPEGDLTLGME